MANAARGYLAQSKVKLIGDKGVGKTAIIMRLIRPGFDGPFSYDPVEEYDHRGLLVVDGRQHLVEFNDAPRPPPEYMALREHEMRSADGFLFVYSITSRASFLQIGPLVAELLQAREQRSLARLAVVLVGNKTDLHSERQVSTDEGQLLAELMGVPFAETTAHSVPEIESVFLQVVRAIQRQRLHEEAECEPEDDGPMKSTNRIGRRQSLLVSMNKVARRFSLSGVKKDEAEQAPVSAKAHVSTPATVLTRTPVLMGTPASMKTSTQGNNHNTTSGVSEKRQRLNFQSQPTEEPQTRLSIDVGAPLDLSDIYEPMAGHRISTPQV